LASGDEEPPLRWTFALELDHTAPLEELAVCSRLGGRRRDLDLVLAVRALDLACSRDVGPVEVDRLELAEGDDPYFVRPPVVFRGRTSDRPDATIVSISLFTPARRTSPTPTPNAAQSGALARFA